MSEPESRGTEGRQTWSRGTFPSATGLSYPQRRFYEGHWAEMAFQAEMFGFTVTGKNEKKNHNPGSRHYVGEAIDVRTMGRTNEDIAAFMAFMRSQGYIVVDERVRPKGQAVWGGPHIHVEWFDWQRLRTDVADALAPVRELR
jgi:hypothetical protein